MQYSEWLYLLFLVVGAAAAWGGAFAAMRTELRHVWREIGRVDVRAEKAHSRIDDYERERRQKLR